MAGGGAELALLLKVKAEGEEVLTRARASIKALENDLVSGATAHAKAGQAAEQHRSKLAGLGDVLGKVGQATAVAGLAIGGAMVAGLAVATKTAADFQSQISGIAAVGGSEAVARMDEIRAKALQVGKDTSFSASEAAAGMEELVKAGVSISDVLGGATDATVALAAATGVDLASSAEIAANAMNQFGLAGEQIGSIADIVAGAANASAIDVNDFKFSLAAAGAAANLAGFTFKDTAVAIAAMGQAGIKGSDAGTSLKTMFMSLQPVTDKQKALFEQLSLFTAETGNQFFDLEGKVKPMREVFGLLNKSLEGYSEQQRLAALETIFGSDAIRAGAIAAKLGAEGFDKMTAAMDKVSAADVAATRLNNLNGGIEALKGSLETAGIIIGTAFLPSLQLMVKGATDVLNANLPVIEQFAADLPSAMARAGDFVTGTLVPAVSTLWTWLSNTLPPALTWISETGWPAVTSAGQAVSAMLAEAVTWWQKVVAEMREQGVFTDLEATWRELQATGTTLTSVFQQLVGPTKDSAAAAVEADASAAGLARGFKSLSGDIHELVSGLRQIVDAANEAGKFLDGLQDQINGAGLAANRFLRSMGVPMGNGFVSAIADGIASGTPTLEAAAAEAAESVPSIFEDRWEMRSPSKVAMAAGFQYASSLAAGIAKGNNAVHEAVLAIVKNALLNNINPMVALALAKVESNFGLNPIGDSGQSVGLFQLHSAGQGAGMSVADRLDPWINAKAFLDRHGALFQKLVAQGLSGPDLARQFGGEAEVSSPEHWHRYATAYSELVAQFGEGVPVLGATSTAMAENGKWAAQMAAQQAALTQTLAGQAPAMRNTKEALAAYGAVLSPIERQVAAGAISLDTLQFKLVDLARATGVTTKPWEDYAAGLIDVDEAMFRVINHSADAGPEFEALRLRMREAGMTTQEATLQYLQLALGIGKVPEAAAAATSAVGPLAGETRTATDRVGSLTSEFATLKPVIDLARDSLRRYSDYLFELTPERQQEQARAWDSVRISIRSAADALGDYRNQLSSAGGGSGAIPSFHEGGVMPYNGLALLRAGETITKPGQSVGSAGGGGGITNVYVTVQGSVTSEQDLAVKLQTLFIQMGRRNGGSAFGGYA